jgi:hypothetical protein
MSTFMLTYDILDVGFSNVFSRGSSLSYITAIQRGGVGGLSVHHVWDFHKRKKEKGKAIHQPT